MTPEDEVETAPNGYGDDREAGRDEQRRDDVSIGIEVREGAL
jgi:hypothetical protein